MTIDIFVAIPEPWPFVYTVLLLNSNLLDSAKKRITHKCVIRAAGPCQAVVCHGKHRGDASCSGCTSQGFAVQLLRCILIQSRDKVMPGLMSLRSNPDAADPPSITSPSFTVSSLCKQRRRVFSRANLDGPWAVRISSTGADDNKCGSSPEGIRG